MTYAEQMEYLTYQFWRIRRNRTWARLRYAFSDPNMARLDASYCLDKNEWSDA